MQLKVSNYLHRQLTIRYQLLTFLYIAAMRKSLEILSVVALSVNRG